MRVWFGVALKVCYDYCLATGKYLYYGLQNGEECWCGEAGAEYDTLGALDMTTCDCPCAADASTTCGGYNAFQLFEYGYETRSSDYIGCYADVKADRIFSIATSTDTLTAEVGFLAGTGWGGGANALGR